MKVIYKIVLSIAFVSFDDCFSAVFRDSEEIESIAKRYKNDADVSLCFEGTSNPDSLEILQLSSLGAVALEVMLEDRKKYICEPYAAKQAMVEHTRIRIARWIAPVVYRGLERNWCYRKTLQIKRTAEEVGTIISATQ